MELYILKVVKSKCIQNGSNSIKVILVCVILGSAHKFLYSAVLSLKEIVKFCITVL